MRGVLHGAGAALASSGDADLGALVLKVTDERRASGCAPCWPGHSPYLGHTACQGPSVVGARAGRWREQR